ncbi:UNVERIFIED_CONTAM: hypothetical protein Sindi_2740400 [Sesamum indicum]
MAEEFEESEVIFREEEVEDEDSDDTETGSNFQLSSRESRSNRAKRKKLSKKSSVPINIPENVSGRSTWFRYMEEEGEMVPPHVIVGRRVAGKMMAFSVCTGNGRTLKGRDLSEVRNSVLRMTGFLET